MGICHCKRKGNASRPNQQPSRRSRRSSILDDYAEEVRDLYVPGSTSVWWKSVPSKVVDNLILDTLKVIGTLVEK